MSWIDTFSIVGLLLALGAALDFCVRTPAKKSVALLLLKVSSSGSRYAYAGTNALDAIFGSGLFSSKAVCRYAFISFASMVLSYGFAFATTPTPPGSDLILFPAGAGYLTVGMLVVCVVFAILGDIASYSITRVFVKAVDSHQSAIVASGLIVADFVSSLFLFFFTFSLSRVVSFILVINFGAPSHIVSAKTYLPAMVSEGISQIANNTFVSSKIQSNVDIELAKAVSSINQEKLPNFVKWVRDSDLGAIAGDEKFSFIEYSASLKCLALPMSPDEATLSTTESAGLLQAYAHAGGDGKYDPSSTWEEWVKNLQKPLAKCESVLVIAKTMPLAGMVGVAGPANTYLAAVERTLFDAYQILAFKLAPYVAFNPSRGLKEFASSLREMESTSLLGMSGGDPVREAIVDTYAKAIPSQEEGGVNVPFSPMVASSLTSSLLFSLYLCSIALARIAERFRHYAGLIAPKLNVDGAPFTTICLALSSVALLVVLLFRLVGALWLWLFS